MACALQIKPESFNGEPGDKAEPWLTGFKDVCQHVYQLTEQQALQIVPYFLTGPAKAWFIGQPENTRRNTTALVTALHERFDGTDGAFILKKINQMPNESVTDYTTRFILMTNNHDLPTAWLTANYIEGLTTVVRRIVKRQDINTVEGARRAALRAEHAENYENDIPVEVSSVSTSGTSPMEAILATLAAQLQHLEAEVTKLMTARQHQESQPEQAPRQGRNVYSRKSYLCAICDKRGHYEKECFRLPDMRRQISNKRAFQDKSLPRQDNLSAHKPTHENVPKVEQPIKSCANNAAPSKSVNRANLSSSKFAKRAKSPKVESESKSSNHDSSVEPVSLIAPLVKNTIFARVLNAKTQALVDTGAAISCVSKGFLNRSGFQHGKIESSLLQSVKGVGGELISVVGKVNLPVVVAGVRMTYPFHVLESLHHSLIIGFDFLSDNGCKIDLSHGILTIKNGAVQANMTVNSACARTTKPTCIPARQEVDIPVSLTRKVKSDIVLLEPIPNDHCFRVARCLVKPTRKRKNSKSRRSVIRILNPTNEDVHLPMNYSVASISRVDTHQIVSLDSDAEIAEVNGISENSSCASESEKAEFNISNSNLTPEQCSKLNQFLSRNSDVFSNSLSTIGKTNMFTHRIETEPGAKPVHRNHYRQAPVQRVEIERQTKEMLEQGIISQSSSVWNSPVVLVKKKNNTWRFAIDYRQLNLVTKSISHPLPRLEDVFDCLGESSATIFSTLDLNSAYFQMELDPETKHKSAFVTHEGVFEFNRMPFGLKNAPMSFQMLMSQVLRGLHWKFVLCYIDDILVFSRDFGEHLQHLDLVFQKLRQANLTLKQDKCQFGLERVMFLGHILSSDGVSVDPEKTEKVKDFPVPKTQTQLKSFLGLCNYYRRFVKGFANIASPLNQLLKGNHKGRFKSGDWTDACQEAFQTLKDSLSSAPILGFPNMNKEFILSTDASGTAIGYVLGQKDDQGKEYVIAYGGRALTKDEKKWSVTDQECLAVIQGIRTFKHYLSHNKFTVFTDHKALSYLKSLKDPQGRIGRWTLFLQGYDFDIIHRPGTQNGNADAISRIPYDSENLDNADTSNAPQVASLNENCLVSDSLCSTSGESDDDSSVYPASSDDDSISDCEDEWFSCEEHFDDTDCLTEAHFEYGTSESVNLIDEVDEPSEADFAKAQRECPDLDFLIDYLENRTLPDDEKRQRMCIRAEEQFVIKDGLLYRFYQPRHSGKVDLSGHYIFQLAVPKTKVKEILSHYHDSLAGGGHFGIKRTYFKIKNKYWFPGMYGEIKRYVLSCDSCQRSKIDRRRQPPPLKPLPVEEPMSRIHIDILGPLPKTKQGHQFILLIVDSFSKWTEAFPLVSQNAQEIAYVLYNEFICRYGAPTSMVSDRGKNFMSKLVSALCELFHIKRYFTSAYHPQTNATVERANSTLAKVLTAYVDEHHSNWHTLLSSVMMAFRSTPATESSGYSPFQLMFGKEMVLPVDVGLHPKETMPIKAKQFFDELLDQLKICRAVAKENMELAKEKTKQRFDKRAKVPDFQVNDRVLLRENATKPGLSHKLCHKWDGPYLVTALGPNFTYKLQNCQTRKVRKGLVNASRIKHYQERLVSDQSSNENDDDEIHLSTHDDAQINGQQIRQSQGEQPSVSEPIRSDANTQSVEASDRQSSSTQRADRTQGPQIEQPQSVANKGDNSHKKTQVPRSDKSSHATMIRPRKVFKVSMLNGVRWFRCYVQGQKASVWLKEFQIDPDYLCKYWETHTKTGLTRKKKAKTLIFWKRN